VVERARRWTHRGVAVYEVNGRYYREHDGRWIVWRERPRDLVEVVIR
jgi:predicted metal-binding protein